MRISFGLLMLVLLGSCTEGGNKLDRPNILWITIEDLTPMLRCYGDPLAHTPNIDRLAAEGVKYTQAFSTAAVCSPARSCIITGLYAPSLGTQHLRSETVVPDSIAPFPRLLREAGYYCTNNYKEDYNFEVTGAWDESSEEAHWRNRDPGQPFFAVFNLETTHQSQIFGSQDAYEERFAKYLPHISPTDPAQINLPSYFFDSPEIRKLWARYYDNVQIVDLQVREILDQLDADGLRDNTIIFFYSDHGTGMPRGKRALYDSGLRIPFIVAAPEKYQRHLQLMPGTSDDRLISFVDLAPTMLTLLNLPVPPIMPGRPFIGPDASAENAYVFATSDRVDEAYENVRSIRTSEYRYIRNFYPHLPLIQPNYYSDQSEILQEVYRIRAASKDLTPAQASMWLPRRPVEELYHLPSDPEETHNLATDPLHAHELTRLRALCREEMLKTRDSGLMPEAYMYQVAAQTTPHASLQDTTLYPMRRLLDLLDDVYGDATETKIVAYLQDPHPLIQYWTLVALQYRDQVGSVVRRELTRLAQQPISLTSITAAETLSRFGDAETAIPILLQAMRSDNPYCLLMATRAFELAQVSEDPYLREARSIWQELTERTKGQWKGYDLYAGWSLHQVFQKRGL